MLNRLAWGEHDRRPYPVGARRRRVREPVFPLRAGHFEGVAQLVRAPACHAGGSRVRVPSPPLQKTDDRRTGGPLALGGIRLTREYGGQSRV